MLQRRANLAVPVAAFLGLSVSAFLFVQYMLPPPTGGGCPIGGGCHIVRACQLAGMPSNTWPQLGLLGFLTVLPLSLSTRGWARWLLRILGTLGAAIGLTLLIAQKAVCGAFCPYCLVTDTSALVVAAGAWLGRGEPLAISWRTRLAYGLLTLASLGGSTAWLIRGGMADAEPTHLAQLPASVTSKQSPGVVTVVEYMDFACTHCRDEYPELVEALAPYGERVRLVRRYAVITPDGRSAALAALCADAQGKLEPMAGALMKAEDLGPASCETLATGLGLDLSAFRACVAAPETSARLQADLADITALHLVALPTIFVGHDRYDGNVPARILRASLDAELRALQQGAAGVAGGITP